MKFGDIPVADAEGAILAHTLRLADRTLKKGHVLTAEDVTVLQSTGRTSLTAARLESGDLGEDAAAERLAAAIQGPGLALDRPFTGRCNLRAEKAGVAVVDVELVDAINGIDEAVTLATVRPYEAVDAGAIVATVKVITFAVAERVLDHAGAIANAYPTRRPVHVAPFTRHRIGLLQTVLPNVKESLLDKTVVVTRQRLEPLGAALVRDERCPHDEAAVADALRSFQAGGIDIALVLGASAIVDRRDVVPSAVLAAGGNVERLGMPVDPGNLMLLAALDGMTVLGLPGSARSPRLHGFDWVLQRLVAGLPVSGADIACMGAGGLLKDIASRPMPREHAEERDSAASSNIAAVVLAAGQSRRMGALNKLLAEIDGRPMIARTVDTVLASRAEPVIVVTGHEADRLQEALAGREVRYVHNPAFAEGLSGSLQAGLREVPETADGALVCLGDMPEVSPEALDRLIEAFVAADRPAICVPTHNGKRGNPVLWHRSFFAEIANVAGDTGARHLIGEHAESVIEVPIGDGGVLVDVDTPEALAAARDKRGGKSA